MTRSVRVNISLTLDGRYHGAGGPADMSAIIPFAVTDTARDHLTRVWDGATTAVLSRGNGLGFVGFWSTVAEDENADPRDRGYAKWLVDAEKVVFSNTLTEAPWPGSRVVKGAVADVINDLKSTGEGAILVNTSPSVAKPLLQADLVDELYLIITPVLAGGGERLFGDGIPATNWTLTRQDIGASGELALIYTRTR
jgi:hypothetical protein